MEVYLNVLLLINQQRLTGWKSSSRAFIICFDTDIFIPTLVYHTPPYFYFCSAQIDKDNLNRCHGILCVALSIFLCSDAKITDEADTTLITKTWHLHTFEKWNTPSGWFSTNTAMKLWQKRYNSVHIQCHVLLLMPGANLIGTNLQSLDRMLSSEYYISRNARQSRVDMIALRLYGYRETCL